MKQIYSWHSIQPSPRTFTEKKKTERSLHQDGLNYRSLNRITTYSTHMTVIHTESSYRSNTNIMEAFIIEAVDTKKPIEQK